MHVAFDCDGTLLNYDSTLRDETCRLLLSFIRGGAQVTIWSGGGQTYAQGVWQRIIRNYNLMDDDTVMSQIDMVTCSMKNNSKPDLAIDDQSVSLGKFNLHFPPKSE